MAQLRQSVRSEPRSVGGITLAEVLIVVAVLGLLASFLIPSFSSTRHRAELALCQANLHNVGIAMVAYANEHGARLPVSEHLANPHAELVTDLVDDYLQGANLYCPSETREELSHSPANLEAGRITYFYYSCRRATTNYEVSHFLWRNGRQNPKWPRLITRAGVQGATSWQPNPWVMSDRWVSGEQPHPIAQKGLNYLLLDGRVDMADSSPRDDFR